MEVYGGEILTDSFLLERERIKQENKSASYGIEYF